MQLLNKKYNIQELTVKLPALIKEFSLDVVIGSMQVTDGVLILLFSHRNNREVPLVVSGTHDLPKVLSDVQGFLGNGV